MNASALRTVFGLLAALLFSSAASAQLFRAYLSSAGSDANPCTLAAPCRLLPAALAAVASKGEIWMLDSANFNTGTVNVTKSVTILAIPGEVGSVLAQAGSPAIVIGAAGVDVKLRNLVIANNATNPGTDGVSMTSGNSLTIEGCLIANMPGKGIGVSAAARVSVSNGVIRDTTYGMFASGGADVDVSNVNFSGTVDGVFGYGSVADTITRMAVTDSHFTHNEVGVYAIANVSTATVRIAVTRSTFTLGDYGVASQVNSPGGVARVSVSDSLLAGLATYAFYQLGNGAVTESFGDNTVRNNASNVSGTLTPVSSM